MDGKEVTLKLTSEQEEAIKAFFAHNEWEYKEIGKFSNVEFYFLKQRNAFFMSEVIY